MSDDFISSGIKGLLDYGIDLKLESYEEEVFYISQMCDYFNNETSFKAYLSGEKSFEIELDRETPIMEVIVTDSLLSIVPYTEEIFEVFTLILGFIAKKHQSLLEDFRGIDYHKIESLEDLEKTSQEETEENEEDDSDDYEWI